MVFNIHIKGHYANKSLVTVWVDKYDTMDSNQFNSISNPTHPAHKEYCRHLFWDAHEREEFYGVEIIRM